MEKTNEDWNIRLALLDDAQAIAQVHVEAYKTTYAGIFPENLLNGFSIEKRTRVWQDILGSPDPTLLTLVGCDTCGNVMGFVSGGRERSGHLGFDGELHSIYLRQEAQRKGLGTLLVRRFAHELKARGLSSMALWVLALNRSGKFYEALGGQSVARQSIELGGQSFIEIAYGWNDLNTLLYRIRQAEIVDAGKIAEAHVDSIHSLGAGAYGPEIISAWGAPRNGDRYRRAMETGEAFFVAVRAKGNGEDVLGFSGYRIVDGKHRIGVYVRGQAARMGVGTALFEAAERAALQNGGKEIHVDASLVAVGFYKALGFVELAPGQHRLKSGVIMDCVFMRKKLAV